MKTLKLYVVGETSGDPADWHDYGNRAIVAAYTPEEAVALCGDLIGNEVATELSPTVPMIIVHDECYPACP